MPSACPCRPPLCTRKDDADLKKEGCVRNHKMQSCTSVLFISLIFGASISHTFGALVSAKEKRGWTTNSIGYLLGANGVDNHRSFNGFAGKRDKRPDEASISGRLVRTLPDADVLRTAIEFMNFLHLKEEAAGLDNLPSPSFSEETNQP